MYFREHIFFRTPLMSNTKRCMVVFPGSRPHFSRGCVLPIRANSLLMTFYTYRAYLCSIWKGDRRDSNPRPSEPQSADIGCWVLLYVAESARLSPFLCWRLRAIAACCALSGVSSGVNSCVFSMANPYARFPHIAMEHRLSRQAQACFSPTATAVYEMSHTNFPEHPFHALGRIA
jgi:hypothetical protein